LLTKAEIADRVYQLGMAIRDDCRHQQLTLVPVLTGAVIFLADLCRRLEDVNVQIEPVKAGSYTGTESGQLHLDLGLVDPAQIRGRHVLIVEDIVDTGQTMHSLHRELAMYEPLRLEAVSLLVKKGKQRPDCPVHLAHCGFEIEDSYVVGYGLDYEGAYRHLSYITILEEVS
jgi:hypoxanthine phosphoribosyltransferase